MARPYTLKSLVNAIIYENHDAASAAKLFNKSTDFIERVQRTTEYQNLLSRIRKERTRSERNREKDIAEGVVENIPRPTLTAGVEKREDMVGAVQQELLGYDVGNPPPTRFVALYYLSYEDVINETPLTDEQKPNYVSDENWNPATPNQEPGTHYTLFSFRHIVAGTIITRLGAE